MKKFAFISLGLPPSQSGQSMAVYHLLKGFDPASYCLITLKNFYQYNHLGNCSDRLPAHYHFVNPDYQLVRAFVNAAAKLRIKFLLALLLRLRIHQYKRILRAEKLLLPLLVVPGIFWIPLQRFSQAGILISRLSFTHLIIIRVNGRIRSSALLQMCMKKLL